MPYLPEPYATDGVLDELSTWTAGPNILQPRQFLVPIDAQLTSYSGRDPP
jgi:hypothetical protein